MRLPVAAKIALQSAGAIGGTPGSPDSAHRLAVVAGNDVHARLPRRARHARDLVGVEVVLLRPGPSLKVISPSVAMPRPITAAPCICARTRSGLTRRAAVHRDVDARAS